LDEGDFKQAEPSFYAALALSQSAPPEEARRLLPLTLYYLSLLRHQQSRADESRQLHEHATKRLDDQTASFPNTLFQHLMVSVMMQLGEYRRAIPFCEQAIQMELEWKEPIARAEMLWRAGECYSRNGLKDHAVIPLRVAVKIFRDHTGDPRLPAALVTLGNALRKTTPAEAEACYREAADLHVARAQLQSATAAWVNLGVLCSEQGRHAESLEHYQRVLRVREQSLGTPPERIGTVLNNMANCYRRTGKFTEAFASVDRAIELLRSKGGTGLASAYGTRGLIFRDAGRDAEAVEWLRKAHAEHQRVPSPNFDTLIEDLENEVAALTRLGRQEEAATAEERLKQVHAAMKAIPQANQDLEKLNVSEREAVLVELTFGSRPDNPFPPRESGNLARLLSEVLEGQDVGFYAGNVVIPENTTLMFYGPDAEALFRALEPHLVGQPACAGARITIRKHDSHREIILSSRVM
jgi:tetratricopeptide (TPR) repeat protein